MDTSCNYWLGIRTHVFYSNKGSNALLYNTIQGGNIRTDNPAFIALTEEMHEHKNLGVISINEELLHREDLHALISEGIEKNILFCISAERYPNKPVQMMPVLNLQREVVKLSQENDRSTGENIIHYLLNLFLYINADCEQNCAYCADYSKQVLSCKRNTELQSLSLSDIKNIFQQTEFSALQKLVISGGNICRYPDLEGLLSLIREFQFNTRFCLNYQNCFHEKYALLDDFDKDILVTFPISDALNEFLSGNPAKAKIHFIISSEEEYQQGESLIEKYNIPDYQFEPFFNGENLAFFKENVFISEEDILANPVKQRIIFANQKMNTNFFGTLIVLPDGTVKANHNTPAIGNIAHHSILDLLNTEMNENTIWRKIRDAKPCTDCIYQFLCPSPSNYEMVFEKMNLCLYKPS